MFSPIDHLGLSQSPINVEIIINDEPITLLDTGATVTVICQRKFFEK